MMHAAIMAMRGFPMLSSGDEIGQLNGYEYHSDPVLRADSRNLHRTAFDWEKAERRTQPGTVQQQLWDGLRTLESLRARELCFGADATVSTGDPHNDHVLALIRRSGDETLVCLFNFSGQEQTVSLTGMDASFTDLITGREGQFPFLNLRPYQYAWCRSQQ